MLQTLPWQISVIGKIWSSFSGSEVPVFKSTHFLFTFWFNIYSFFSLQIICLCVLDREFLSKAENYLKTYFSSCLGDIYVQEAVIFKPLCAFFKHPDIQVSKKS